MKYAIIGSGNIGSAVAKQFARAGIDVGVAAARGVASVARLVDQIGPEVIPTDVADALQAQTVLLATPFDVVRELVGRVPDWNRRVIIDATNAIDYKDFSPADLGGTPSSDLVGEWAINARVVKSFGHTWAKVLAREPADAAGAQRVLFVSGNHPDANTEVAELIRHFGFTAIDLGRNDEGGLLQQFGGPLTTLSLVSQPIGGDAPGEMDLLAT
jgi:predicted dinucleotide-binding enzyme